MSDVKLNWRTAQVKDASLSVELEGEIPAGWEQSFETTVRVLGNGDWGEVSLEKTKVRVEDITAGSEDKLRHFLESALAQANANQQSGEEERPEQSSDEDEDENEDGD